MVQQNTFTLGSWSPNWITIVALLSMISVCSGCIGNHPWRIHYDAAGVPNIEAPLLQKLPSKNCGAGSQDQQRSFRLAFIEFDDRGELFERRQLDNAVEEIKRVKAASTTTNPAAVVLFVHGWKNNAAPKNPNVDDFKSMLACLGTQFGGNDDLEDPRKTHVLGIYIGWRGAVLSPPFLKELTFWDRRDKAQNLPNAHLVETLLSILKAAKGHDYREPTFSLLIGHSFGGSLLESSLTQTITNIILDTPPGADIHWPADLVVLVNEASQATQSYQLIESMQANISARPGCGPAAPPAQRTPIHYTPKIISITSTGDWATGTLFPLGQLITRPLNSLRKYPHLNTLGFKDQTSMYLKTTAHLTPFFSHRLGQATAPAIASARAVGCEVALQSDIDIDNQTHRFQMVELPGAVNLTPYWVMAMPRSIVPDHNTIFRGPFRDLMVDLVLTERLVGTPYIRKKP